MYVCMYVCVYVRTYVRSLDYLYRINNKLILLMNIHVIPFRNSLTDEIRDKIISVLPWIRQRGN